LQIYKPLGMLATIVMTETALFSRHQGSEFNYFVYDARRDLARVWPDWDERMLEVALNDCVPITFSGLHGTSRESKAAQEKGISTHTVGGRVVAQKLRPLFELYTGPFRDLVEDFAGEEILPGATDDTKINLNVQLQGNRYEGHVDTNPYELLLPATDHPPGTGGELVVAGHDDVHTIEEIEASHPIIIHPRKGMLLIFNGMKRAHYVRQQQAPIRVLGAGNYYTKQHRHRPVDLTNYLRTGRVLSTTRYMSWLRL
jgi:hypothetical protein